MTLYKPKFNEKTDDPDVKRDDPPVERDNPSIKRDDPFVKTDDLYEISKILSQPIRIEHLSLKKLFFQ